VKNERADEGETFDLRPPAAGNDEDDADEGGGDGVAGVQQPGQQEMPGQQDMQGPLVGGIGALNFL